MSSTFSCGLSYPHNTYIYSSSSSSSSSSSPSVTSPSVASPSAGASPSPASPSSGSGSGSSSSSSSSSSSESGSGGSIFSSASGVSGSPGLRPGFSPNQRGNLAKSAFVMKKWKVHKIISNYTKYNLFLMFLRV